MQFPRTEPSSMRTLLVLLMFAVTAFGQEKKQPLPKDLSTVPSLNRTFDQGMSGLSDRFKMKKRDSLTPGIDNWFYIEKKQEVVLSLKCVGKTVIAGSMEVPMTPAHEKDAAIDQLMTLSQFLANLCPDMRWDAAPNVLALAGAIEMVTKDKTVMYKREEDGLLVYALAMPARKSVQFNVISTKFLKMNYDSDGL